MDLGDVEVRRPVRIVRLLAAVDQDPRLGGREQERGPPDLAAASEGGDPDPLVLVRDLAVDPPTDRAQELLALVVDRSEILPDLLDRLALDRRRAHDLRRPADLLRDLAERRPVLADHDAGLLGLDQDLARVGVEEEVGDPGVLGDHAPDLGRGTFGVLEYGRPDHDPLPEVPGQRLDQVGLVREPLRVVGVDDELRPLELDLRDRDAVRHFAIDLVFEISEPLFNSHVVVLKKENQAAVTAAAICSARSSVSSSYRSAVITTTCTPSPDPASRRIADFSARTARSIACSSLMSFR